MLDIFEDNKNKIIIGGITLVILFVVYNIFSSDEEPIKLIKKEIIVQEVSKQIKELQIEEKTIIVPQVEKKVIVEKKIEKQIEEEPIQDNIAYDSVPKEEEITLYSTKDNTGRYTINLKSKVKVKPKNAYIIKYVMFNGIIENNSESSEFVISLNQDYLDFANETLEW